MLSLYSPAWPKLLPTPLLTRTAPKTPQSTDLIRYLNIAIIV
jgi:hypothetical protein